MKSSHYNFINKRLYGGWGGRRWVEQDGAAGPRDVISHLGQQVAQLSLSLKAPQPSGVGTGHIHY